MFIIVTISKRTAAAESKFQNFNENFQNGFD